MEVAGTAVGVASLGIQVCQGLLSYYRDCRAFSQDINSLYDAVADLKRTLEFFDAALNDGSLNDARARNVRECLKSCESGVKDLSGKLKSLRQHVKPVGLQQRAFFQLQKFAYPLRKSTLDKIQKAVADTQGRLALAVQDLHLDISKATRVLGKENLLLGQNVLDVGKHTLAVSQTVLKTSEQAVNTGNKTAVISQQTLENSQKILSGEWFLSSDEYQTWKSGGTGHLWLHGSAGSGKTVLCSTIVEDVQRHCQSDHSFSSAFFYFSFSEDSKQSDDHLMRSLVAQLGWREPTQSKLRALYEAPLRKLPSALELESLLLSAIEACDRTFIVLDALDECPDEHDARSSTLDRLEWLARCAPKARVLTTSRELRDIRQCMNSITATSSPMQASVVDRDIQVYVSAQLSSDRRFKSLGSDTRDLIQSTLVARSGGMFRWAYCQMQELKKLRSTKPKYVREALNSLPKDLDGTYARILHGIEPMYQREALALLRWLTYARSPLTLAELAEAAIIDPAADVGSRVDVGNRGGGLDDALNILTGLVTVMDDETSDEARVTSPSDQTIADDLKDPDINKDISLDTKVRLAHFSVKEYLESDRIRTSPESFFTLNVSLDNRFLSHSCLAYLEFYAASHDKACAEEDLTTFPLLRYAAGSWFQHSAIQIDDDDMRGATFLLSSASKSYWLNVYDPDSNPWKLFSRSTAGSGTALWYASKLGLASVFQDLLSVQRDLCRSVAEEQQELGLSLSPAKGAQELGHALKVAAEKGHMRIFAQLLEQKPDLTSIPGGADALHIAAHTGHTDMVRLLLDGGAPVNLETSLDGTALHCACEAGSLSVARLLISRGAEVGICNAIGEQPLHKAAYAGQAEIVKLLLDNGADINAPSDFLGTPWHAAVAFDAEDCVQVLIARGADVNAHSSRYGSVVALASTRRNDTIQGLLIEHGATASLCHKTPPVDEDTRFWDSFSDLNRGFILEDGLSASGSLVDDDKTAGSSARLR